jgi:pSer/pThr/pTyr-binding forkhead associated (FHA) protein
MGSKNGTFVNDERISPQLGNDPAELKNGDEVRIGHQVVQVHVDDHISTKEFVGSQALAEWIT